MHQSGELFRRELLGPVAPSFRRMGMHFHQQGVGAHGHRAFAQRNDQIRPARALAGVVVRGLLVTLLYAVATAPVGYQDETGFHLGVPDFEKPEGGRPKAPVASGARGAFALTLRDYFARQQTHAGGTN